MEIEVTGIAQDQLEITKFIDPEHKVVYYDTQLKYTIENFAGYSHLTIDVVTYTFIPPTLTLFKTGIKTSFKIINKDLSYLSKPTNPTTIKICCDLTQVAVSHARVFTLMSGQENGLGNICIPYLLPDELLDITKNSLLASLN